MPGSSWHAASTLEESGRAQRRITDEQKTNQHAQVAINPWFEIHGCNLFIPSNYETEAHAVPHAVRNGR